MDSDRILILTKSALFLAVIVIQEFVLSFIPGVQLTSLLLTIYFYMYGTKRSLLFLVPYVLLDNLLMGSFNVIYTPVMLIGWCILILLLVIFRTKNVLMLGIVVGFHGFIYSWCFAIASSIVYEVNLIQYLLMDIPFEMLMALNGFLTIFFLFKVLKKAIDKIDSKDIASKRTNEKE